ncbi:MAG: amino acid adenylation domain-containing protein [Planctomycetota bacterium]
MSDTVYLLAPQQERVIDGLLRRGAEGEPLERAGASSGAAFRVQLVVRPAGALTPDELGPRVRAAAERHEVLRMRLAPRPGARRPAQRFAEPATGDASIEIATAPLAEVCRTEWERSFDLSLDPPLRVVCVREGDDLRLVLTASAVALDARSTLALAKELCGAPSADDPEALDWLGATAFFREWLEDDEDEEACADRAHFDAAPSGEAPRWPRVDEHAGSAAGFVRHPIPLAPGVAQAIDDAAARADVPAEAFWLAALHAFLARTSALARPAVRVASDGRAMEELDAVLGPVSRWLPAASAVDPGTSARALAGSLARELDAAREHEHGCREADGDGEAFAFARLDTDLAGAGEVELLRAVELDAPVIAQLSGAGKGLGFALEVDHDRVDPDAAETLAASLAAWLTAVAHAPEAALRDHALLAPGPARERALGGPYAAPAEAAAPFLERFAASVAAAPERPAVVSDSHTLTYAELDRRTLALAARLRAAGAGPEQPVAVVMSRTHHAIVAMLAAIRAGAPYLPLDPVLPKEALGLRLDDAGAAVVLTEALLVDRVPEGRPRWMLDAEEDAEAPAGPALALPPPEGAAYLLYTSGSTGKPKAVVVEHRQLAAYVAAIEPRIGVGAGACWGNLSTLAADLGHTTLFPALASAGTLRLFGEESMGNARVLAEHLRACPIDVLKIVPSHLAALLDGAGAPEAERALLPRRALLLGGEPLPRALVDRIGDAVPTLLNHYGPTEATVGVAVGDARSADLDGTVPIGHPLGSARLYVLDASLAPVPVGVAGELFAAGPTVTRGYRGRAARTAERFLPDPFSGETGARMYRTGDRVRRLADGSLEFLGRLDLQVKVRGFRVELGEVEAAIAAHSDVAQAVVKPVGEPARLAAWVVPRAGARLEPAELRGFVKPKLAVYMWPSAWVVLRTLPLTANGKVDRAALPDPDVGRPELGSTFVPPRGRAERDIAAMWCELLELERVGVEDNFFDLGGHSLLLVQLMSKLEARFERDILVTELFQYPTVAAMARWLADEREGGETAVAPRAPRRAADDDDAIAIVGMSARFPEAPSVDAYWENLRAGRDGVRRLDRETLLAAGVDAAVLDDPRFVAAGPVLDDIDRFDAAFFGIPPRQAQIMDPQHRLLMESAWGALEHAGIAPGRAAGRVGVFAGAGFGSYFLRNLAGAPELLAAVGVTAVRHANRIDNLATRVAYHLDLAGPAVTVQSGCSSSLVAVHLAAQSLRAGDADVALAGGVTVNTGQGRGYNYQPGGINAPDGRCRAFDASAAGTVFGSGVGVVVLKRLSDALADGDTVHGVVLGSAMNNDGAGKPGYTAPSVDGQAAVVSEALARAGVAPADVDFVEAHGTGTLIGDPIEVAALTRAFGGEDAPRGTCALGSVKSSIGHLDAAAGIAGLLKATLALSHGEVPPTLHFEEPNPRLDLERTPFRIATELAPIDKPPAERRAGVSSFGIGGTNVHVVLGGPPAPRESQAPAEGAPTVLVLSARREEALDRLAADLGRHLAERPDASLDDVAWTLATGRRPGPHRRAVVCADRDEAARALAGELPERVRTRVPATRDAEVAFLFPGQGAQTPGMAARPRATDAAFRAAFDAALAAVESGLAHVGHAAPGELRELLLDPDAPNGPERLADTRLAQPALFAVELALAEAWSARGVQPVAMLGHSLGELVAATRAGVFALEDAARLVALRGQLLAAQPPGAMLAVRAGRDDLEPWLAEPGGEGVHLSAINGASDVTVGGAAPAIEAFAARLERTGVAHRGLATSHAFHVPQMSGAVEPFRDAVSAVERHAPAVPFVSVRTGTWIRDEDATDPEHWAAQLVEPVRFSEALAALVERFDCVALEVGPGRALGSLVRRDAALPVVPSLAGGADHPLASALAELWLHGAALDWERALPGGRRRHVPLPTYPFARERHWIDPRPGGPLALRAAAVAAARPAEDAPAADDATEPVARPARTTPYAAPKTEHERLLVGLWEQVLGVPEIGVHDDFFELGGDSVQGLQILTLAREAGYELDPADLFERQTIAALAEVLRPASGGVPAARTSLPDGPQATPRRVVPCTAEQRLWLDAGGAPAHVALVSCADDGALADDESLASAASALVQRHGALRLRAARAGGAWIQRLVDPGEAEWLIASRDVAGAELEPTIAELARELDPLEGPVAAAVRLRGGDGDRIAVLAHPLVADRASLARLVRELLGADEDADPHALDFADFAEAELLAALDGRAAAPSTSGRVPRDHPLGEARAHDRTVVERDVPGAPAELADLTAAAAGALAVWSGLERVAVALELEREGKAARSVGCFTARAAVELTASDGRLPAGAAHEAIAAVRDGFAPGDGALPDVLVRVRTADDQAPAGAAPWTRDDALRPHAIEIELRPATGEHPARLVVEHSLAVHRPATIERLADDVAARLTPEKPARAAEQDDPPTLPSDEAPLSPEAVSAASIRPADLERLLAVVQRSGESGAGEQAR